MVEAVPLPNETVTSLAMALVGSSKAPLLLLDDDLVVVYRISARLTSADLIVARIYLGIPIFGKTKTLQRVPHGTAEGWC